MLKTIIEIHPFGENEYKRNIGTITIFNDLTNENRPKYGNYTCLYKDMRENKSISVKVKNHKREDGFLELLYETIGKILKKEKSVKKSKNKELS